MIRPVILRAAPVAAIALATVLALLAACEDGGRSPVEPEDPGDRPSPPGAPVISIALEGDESGAIPWGAPMFLRATVEGAEVDSIVWVSLDDHHLAHPVVLGRGETVSTHPLKPGVTRVEARLVSNGEIVARATRDVEVEYRESWNVAREGFLAYPAETVGDVWVHDGHAYLARRGSNGISIVRLAGGPVEVGRYAPEEMFTQDVKVADGVAYVSNEPHAAAHPWGVTLLDVTDPTAPRPLGGVPLAEVGGAVHNVWIEGALLTLASQRTDAVHLYDVSDPSAPRALSRVTSERGTAHDMLTRDGLLFGSFLALGDGERGEMTIADVSRPESPAVLARIQYAGAFTHSAWLSDDGSHLYVLDELVNAPIRIYDVSSPADPRLVGTYQPRLGTIPHNLLVRDGRFAYVANYKNGVEVLDVSDPARPRLIGFFDTHPGVARDDGWEVPSGSRAPVPAHEKGGDLHEGAWGVHWDDTGRIVVSDMQRGLFVFRYVGP